MTESLLANGLLILVATVTVIVGAILIQRARNDVFGESSDDGRVYESTYRAAFERGLMTDAEYRRIQEQEERRRRGRDKRRSDPIQAAIQKFAETHEDLETHQGPGESPTEGVSPTNPSSGGA